VRCLCRSLLTAEWETLALSFGQVTRFRHINLWNALSFNKYVFPFQSITLRSQQLVIIPGRAGSPSRRRNCGRNLHPLILGQFRDLRGRNESRLRLYTILRLLKRLFQSLSVDFRGAVFAARVNYSSRKETGESAQHGETRHRRWNFKIEFPKDANPDRHIPNPKASAWSSPWSSGAPLLGHSWFRVCLGDFVLKYNIARRTLLVALIAIQTQRCLPA
jgi:hypothetical protein